MRSGSQRLRPHHRLLSLAAMLACFIPAWSRVLAGSSENHIAPKKPAHDSSADKLEVTEAEKKPDDTPQVQIFIPSLTHLADAFKTSRTGKILDGFSAMMKPPQTESSDDFDYDAVLKLLAQVRSWPDTSLAICIFSKDAEGNTRWAIRVDWPLEKTRERLAELLKEPAAQKVIGKVRLIPKGDSAWQVELPDMPLAALEKMGRASVVKSSMELKVSRSALQPDEDESDSTPPILSCRYNIGAGSEGESSSFGGITGIRDVTFESRMKEDGRWSETWKLGWNPLIGMVAKSAVKRVVRPFDQPREALATGAFSIEPGASMADSVGDLPRGTLAPHIAGELAFAVAPGTGFLPVPDLYLQWHVRSASRLLDAIRKAIANDSRKRRDDDRPIAWHEIEVDGRPAFWLDPGASEGGGLRPWTMRTVIFFEGSLTNESARPQMVIARTSTGAQEAIKHWKELRQGASDSLKSPDNDKSHWQAVIHWNRLYRLTQPWLALAAGFGEAGALPPSADELDSALCDSVLDVQIKFGGVTVRHTGPLPLGAVYVPAIAAMALEQSVDWSSEAAREQAACENLRTLQHHARLFRKDFGRWPATVKELDGYIDFASNSYLLRLWPKNEGLLSGMIGMVKRDRSKPKADSPDDDDDVDTSLYRVVKCSKDHWKVAIRADEFKRLETISIDETGTLERVQKQAAHKPIDTGTSEDSFGKKAESDTISDVESKPTPKRVTKHDDQSGENKSKADSSKEEPKSDGAKERRAEPKKEKPPEKPKKSSDDDDDSDDDN